MGGAVWSGLYRAGPGLGLVLGGAVAWFFQKLFETPIYVTEKFIQLAGTAFSWINWATSGLLEYGTGWVQSTFQSTEDVQKGIKNVVVDFYKYVESRNRFIKFILTLSRILVFFVLDSILAVYKAIPHFLFLALLLYIWFFTGYPLLFVAAFPQSVSDNINVYITGAQSYINIFIYIYNSFALAVNIFNPFFQGTISYYAQLVTIVSKYLFESFSFQNTAEFGGGRNTRDLAETVSQRSTQSTPFFNLFSDTEFEFDEALVIAERTFLIAESRFVTRSYSAIAIMLTVWELVLAIFPPFIQPIIDAIALGGASASCCFFADGTGSALGYCAIKWGISILLGLLRLVGFSTPGIVAAVNGLLPKTVSGSIPCQCHGIIRPVPACKPPTYDCVAVIDGQISTYREVQTIQRSVDKVETTVTGVGTTQSLACPNYVRLQRRGLDTCKKICHKERWLVRACDEFVEYLGGCDSSAPLNYKEEVMEFLKSKPKFLSHSQVQNLLHSHPPEKKEVKSVYFPGDEEEEEEEVIDFENLKKRIHELELEEIPGCPHQFDSSFESSLFRFFCLALRMYKVSPPDVFNGVLNQIPDHVQHFGDHRSLQEAHTEWYKERTGKDSILVTLNSSFAHVLTNFSAQLLHSKLRQEKYEAHKRRRILEPENPVQSEYPFCEYKCPAGECVKRSEIQLCTVPTNWTLGVTTRYIAYITTASLETFDPQFLVESVLSCWKELLENPSLNPATLRGFLEYVSGSDMASYKYCFPLFKNLPYLPIANFNWNRYINSICTPNKEFKGPNSISQCACTQYNTVDVFNYAAWSTIFTPVFVTARLFNAWKAIQWFLVNLPIGLWNSFWRGTAIWANPQGSLEIIYAFDYNFALSGQSVDKNWGCSALHAGEVIFALLVGYLLWIVASYFGKLLYHFFLDLLRLLVVDSLHWLLSYVTLYLYTTRVLPFAEKRGTKMKLAYQKNLNV